MHKHTSLCALNFPEGESGCGKEGGGGKRRGWVGVVKGPFPAVLISFNTNVFKCFYPLEEEMLYIWCEEYKRFFFFF